MFLSLIDWKKTVLLRTQNLPAQSLHITALAASFMAESKEIISPCRILQPQNKLGTYPGSWPSLKRPLLETVIVEAIKTTTKCWMVDMAFQVVSPKMLKHVRPNPDVAPHLQSSWSSSSSSSSSSLSSSLSSWGVKIRHPLWKICWLG